MAVVKIVGSLIGLAINIILIPIVVIVSIPVAILKARRDQKNRLLFTGEEQALLAKAQRVINMKNNSPIALDRDLLEVADCIEEARSDYQIRKGLERFDVSFFDFVAPKIVQCQVTNWSKVSDFFDLPNLYSSPSEGLRATADEAKELFRSLKTCISNYEHAHGFPPKRIELDKSVYMLFMRAGIFIDLESSFEKTEVFVTEDVSGGLLWKAEDPVWELHDDDVPF